MLIMFFEFIASLQIFLDQSYDTLEFWMGKVECWGCKLFDSEPF